MSEVLMKGLAAKGHEVVVISHFPQKTPIPNYTDISLVGSMPNFVSTVPLNEIATGRVYTTVKLLAELGVTGCEKTLSHPPVLKLINSKEKFDLVITELFNTDCYVAFAHKFQVPFISIITTPLLPWGNERVANPDNPSYIANLFLGHCDRMSFLERLVNTIYLKVLQWEYHYWFNVPSEKIARKYFGETLPPLADIVRNTSVVLVNRHFSLNRPVPNVPAVIEVGGLHVEVPKKLPTVSEESLLSKLAKHAICIGSSRCVSSVPSREYTFSAFKYATAASYQICAQLIIHFIIRLILSSVYTVDCTQQPTKKS